jgi:hypothetical protein
LSLAGLLDGLFRSILCLLDGASSSVLCLLSSLLSGVLCLLGYLFDLSGRLIYSTLRLLGNFLETRGEVLGCLVGLIYRLACGVLHPLRSVPNLVGHSSSHLSGLTGRLPGYFTDLLSNPSNRFANLAGYSSSHLSDLAGRFSGHFSNLTGRLSGHLPDLLGHSSNRFANLATSPSLASAVSIPVRGSR